MADVSNAVFHIRLWWTTHDVPLTVWVSSSKISQFLDFGILTWKSLFTVILGEFLGHIPQNNITHHPNPKKDRPLAEPRHMSHKLWLIWRGSAQEGPFWGKDDEWHYLGETCPTNPLKTGVNRHFQAKLPNLKIAIFPKPYTRSVQNLMAKLTPSTARRGWSTRAVGPIWNTTWLTSAILKINIAS